MTDPFLEQPNLTRVMFELDGRFKVGGCSMQGWRRGMEDSHTAILDVFDDGTASFFCVCDGHGGGTCAEEVTKNVLCTPSFRASFLSNSSEKTRLYCFRTKHQEPSFKQMSSEM